MRWPRVDSLLIMAAVLALTAGQAPTANDATKDDTTKSDTTTDDTKPSADTSATTDDTAIRIETDEEKLKRFCAKAENKDHSLCKDAKPEE
jgi:hypothetical protein